MSFDLHHSNESGYDDTNDSNILYIFMLSRKMLLLFYITPIVFFFVDDDLDYYTIKSSLGRPTQKHIRSIDQDLILKMIDCDSSS